MTEKIFNVEEDHELRVQVYGGEKMELTLQSGSAEILGTELAPKRVYLFRPVINTVFPIHTWNGCKVKLTLGNKPYEPYIAKKIPMPMYLNAHICLERLRLKPKDDKIGPTVMVTGPKNCGKNSLCKILSNYAIRDGRSPIFVDVDVGQSIISIPGSVGAVVLDHQTDVENEDMSRYTSLVYNFGSNNQHQNLPFYKLILSKIADKIKLIKQRNSKVCTSGVIINTTSWTDNDDYKLLLKMVDIFEVDVILVLESEQLYNDFNNDLPIVNTAYLPKSDGIIDITWKEEELIREDKMRNYFYGTIANEYQPHTIQMPFKKIRIFKFDSSRECSVLPSLKLKNVLLALSMASKETDLQSSSIAGYVCVIAVDEGKKILTLLSPQPQPFPKSLFILTKLNFSTWGKVYSNNCKSCPGCDLKSGDFQRDILAPGYNLVITIPRNACNITIYEQDKSQNFLAIRAEKNYIINGNWEIVPRGRYMGAGTRFDYSYYRSGQHEIIFTQGPITTEVDVMVIYQSGNVKIYYEYYQPEILLPDRPGKQEYKNVYEDLNNKNYYMHDIRFTDDSMHETTGTWKVWKFTPCSKPCGGGDQGTIFICTAADGRILQDSKCKYKKPPPQMIPCNSHPCAPRWSYSPWSPCSVTCGTGHRYRTVKCIQEVSSSVILNLPLPRCYNTGLADVSSQQCNMNPCTRWQVEEWLQCSVRCGTGVSTRIVKCASEGVPMKDDLCNPQERPHDQRLCHSFSCARNTWFFTEWSRKCIGGCAHGIHVREVWCSPGSNSLGGRCLAINKPPVTKPCTNSDACGAIWFVGPWSAVSGNC